MTALGLTVAIFAVSVLLGLSATVAVRRSDLTVIDVLLAPATGFAVAELPLVALNRAGLPVDSFATLLVAALVTSAAVTGFVYRARIVPALRRCGGFGFACLVALFIVATPMVSVGLNWFSYANDDGVNYALNAERFRVQGVNSEPHAVDYIAGLDIRSAYYFLNYERYATDEVLAAVSSFARVDAFRALMPSLVALHLAAMLAVGALGFRGPRPFITGVVCATGYGLCALATFGLDYQLLGQLAGVLFLTASIVRACSSEVFESRGWDRIAAWGLPVVVFAALCEAYPEMAPFAVLTIAGHNLFRRPRATKSLAAFATVLVIGTAVLIGGYAQTFASVLLQRAHAAPTASSLFPYYLLPSGLAHLFGLTPVAVFPQEPWASLAIVAGIILLIATALATGNAIRRGAPAGYLALLYLAVGVVFFVKGNGFGLYKLAMFAQPAIVVVLLSATVSLLVSPRRPLRYAVAAFAGIVFIANLSSQRYYTAASAARSSETSAIYAEIPDISTSALFDQLDRLRLGLVPGDRILSDAFNRSLGKIEAFYARRKAPIVFPGGAVVNLGYSPAYIRIPLVDRSQDAFRESLFERRKRRFSRHEFPVDATMATSFLVEAEEPQNNATIWVSGIEQSPFNRTSLMVQSSVASIPSSRAKNILVFVGSSRGAAYYAQADKSGAPTAIFQLEPDFFNSKSGMSGVGRYLLFEVMNPERPLRLSISLTDTLSGDGIDAIPPVAVIGTTRVPFGLSGRGSARVVSPPVIPRIIAGHSYVLIDLGTPAKRFPRVRAGLMQLWGRGIPLDDRELTGFVRDISALGPSYHPRPPTQLTRFPDDLMAPNLEYSGIYEDGWASEDFSVKLDCGVSGNVVLRGALPNIADPNFTTDVAVSVDGFPISTEHVAVGEQRIAVLAGPGVHRIRWRFSHFQRLPNGDQRPATLLIKSISAIGDGA